MLRKICGHWRAVEHRKRLLSSQRRALPDFIIVGAQKAGTTFLYHVLSQHPDVLAASEKEVHYFDDPQNFRRGENWYRAHFPLQKSLERRRQSTERTILTGEASPYYLAHPMSAPRAAQLVPQAKLIVLLRNPTERAYSHFGHNKARETLSFEDALADEDERLSNEAELLNSEPFYSENHRLFSYRARGIYLPQIQHWEEFFPRAQMLILPSEGLFRQTSQNLESVFAFLNLAPRQPRDLAPQNEGRSKEKMKPATHDALQHFFAPHNQRLYEHLGTDFGWDK